MAYKLAEEDKLCGVIYPTYEGFSPIPKVTCDMLESKCEQTIIVKCGEDSTSESTSTTTSTSESTSVSTSLSTSESTSESVSESSSTENSNTPEEPKPNPEPQPEPVPTINLLEVLPKVDDKFSKLIVKDGQVVEVPEVSEEDKRTFEDKIINDLKTKLPEGTTVEAVLEGPAYEKGSEVIGGKTNYNLKVRTTLNGKVSEHTYKVPHTEEPAYPDAPEEVFKEVLNSRVSFGEGIMEDNTLTKLNFIGGAITESVIKQFEESQRKEYEDKLNEGRPDSVKYKVEYKVTQLKHIGDSLSPVNLENSIFTSHIKITKPYGDVIEKDKPVTTFVIEIL